ncbi:unnamed protein product [Polarella glacialis]|uniref:NADH:ubiquinone reductase (non-electrogenic) n=1 Tax=Polarella glacialis TaxID=89957 RepID=A0A813FA68_POLGL|nr:unnamed protein product [Polarella glacialis]
MKETMDATVFKDHILERLEQASYYHAGRREEHFRFVEEAKIKELLTFVVVGGGPTGVELAGELTDFLHNEGLKLYGHLKQHIQVHMFTYDVLGPFDKEIQEYALKHLVKKQAGGRGNQPRNCNQVKSGATNMSIGYGTLVWCAGIKPHDFIKDLGLAMNGKGTQILTDHHLRVVGEEDIYAIGDCSTADCMLVLQCDGGSRKYVCCDRYLGGANAVMAQLPGSGLVVMQLCQHASPADVQIVVRNRFMLSTDWLRTLVFGRDLTRIGPCCLCCVVSKLDCIVVVVVVVVAVVVAAVVVLFVLSAV